MIILSVDPGTYYTGYAIFNDVHRHLDNKGVLDYGVIESSDSRLSHRLHNIRVGIKDLIEKYQVNMLVMESYFFHTNTIQGKYILHAQGVILEAASEYNIDFDMITPSEVKKYITNNGIAKKDLVKQEIIKIYKEILDKNKFSNINKTDDIYDAIAIGHTWIYTKLNTYKSKKQI